MPICQPPVEIRTFDRSVHGLRTVICAGDGYTVAIEWNKAFVKPSTWDLVYNLYWSSEKSDVFTDGVKFVVDSSQTNVLIRGGFKRGDIYYFAVRASAHEPDTLLFDQLPEPVPGLRTYPEAALIADISETETVIPVDDVSTFPPAGIVLIHAEPITYSSIDLLNNTLVLSSVDQRGTYGYEPRIHTTDGYDGVHQFDNSFVSLWKGFEDGNNAVGLEEIKFEERYARTNEDGYRERVDILTSKTNLDVVDSNNADFPPYDNTGYQRTNITDLLAGKCVGSYFGGEIYCADGYDSDGRVRGQPVNEIMNGREEMILETTGEPVMLFKRMWTGKESFHYSPTRENTAYRGLDNFGTSLVSGYEQFFNPRRSDGKILVRFGPTKEDLKREDPGIENEFFPNCWTLVFPSIQDGDFFIRFNQDGSPEWRYEIINVERNRVLLQETGRQNFTAVRVRKTDPIYQVRSILSTAMFPSEILTSLGSVSGPGGILPHMHRVVTSPGQPISQMTSVEQGHNHPVLDDYTVVPVLGHSHVLIVP